MKTFEVTESTVTTWVRTGKKDWLLLGWFLNEEETETYHRIRWYTSQEEAQATREVWDKEKGVLATRIMVEVFKGSACRDPRK